MRLDTEHFLPGNPFGTGKLPQQKPFWQYSVQERHQSNLA